ncbi:aldo/keto reductase [Nonomuraea insulae]|uniref:Aldo/keto reductase n=1 Tax=Nonomuraea insulae TaxID=1616787 RepID=A0ABW1D989_9ACTN
MWFALGRSVTSGCPTRPAWAVAHAATIAGFRGWTGVAAIQVEYSLLERTVEGELFGAARAFGLGVTPWSPLANGLLSGKYTRDDQAPPGSNRPHHVASRLTERTFTVVEALQRITDGLGASIAAVALALAWVHQQQPVTSTIIGVRTAAQLDANLASLDVSIPDEKLTKLDALTTPHLNFPADVLKHVAVDYQQRGVTVKGVASRAR